VICTSGSTGSPKAVALEHRSLVNFVLAAARAYPVEARDRVLQFASPGFDAALEEIFTTLTAGATLVIRTAEDAASIPDFLAACRRRAVTVASLPTAFWHELIRHAEAGHLEPPDALRLVVIGGERARPDAAAAWRRWTAGRIRLLNTYGPTEAGVVATCADLTLPEPDGEDTEPPIGRPLANVTAYVLDALRQPAPVGVTGELFLGGAGIARGYWREETLTAERFVPDSFSGAPGVRLYRTGDLARWRPDGQLEFAGRLDNQIKLRGHRIEPGEIESCLNTHPAVRESLVLLREAASGPRLAAYLTPRPGQSPDAADLRRHLRQRLPEIMVPAHFVTLAAWPLTARGKIDRRALPAPGASESGPSAPMNATERRVAAVWGDVLGVRGIGRDSHFFDLGGHSLLAMQVLARLQHEFGARPTLRQFFEAPTVAALAAALDSLPVREELERLAAGPRPARVPASFAQQRLWFLEQLEPGGAAYHIPALARLRGDLDADRLRRGLNGVIRRHESLRTTFVAPDGEPEQVIAPALDLPLPREDWRDLAPRERDARLAELRAAEAARPFDLNRGPLLRARLVRVADDDWFLLLTLHHLIADGWSVGVLLAELARDYDALAEGAPASPPPPAQYADYTLWQRARLRGPALERDLAFWTQHLAGAPPALEFPTDHPRPPVPRFAAASATLALPASLGAAARALAREEGATLFMTLLAVFQALLHRLTGQSDLVVGTPVAGRTTAETENLVGLFVNTLALRSRVGPGPDLPGFREFLRRARATCLDAFSHQEAPFEQLVERLQPARDRGRTPVFQVFFNLLNLAKPGFTSRHLRFEGLELTDSGAKFDFTLYVRERPDGDELHLVYNRELFDAARMEELLRQYRALLAQAVRQPETPLHSLSLVTLEAAALLPNPRDPLRAQWHGPVPELFARQARRTPERVAVTGAGASWTYAALDRRARQVAQRLRAGGVQRGDVVAIHARRHPALAVALLGVFKAGAVTMLLDSNYPAALLRGLVASVKPRGWVHLAAGRAAPEDILALARRCDCFVDLTANEGEASLPADAPDADPGVTLAADDLACLSFTSGTTGRPRGVLTTHGPLSHFFNWQPAQFGLNETDRFSVLSGLGHDPLLRNIFTALSIGATVCVPDDATVRDPDRLLAWLREERITVAHLTPGVAQLLAGTEETRRRDGLPHLRWAFFGGDKLRRADAAALRALAPGVRCVNFYGTTETPQAMSWCEVAEVGKGARCPDPAAVVPIGRGIPAAQLLVLAGAGQLAGVGEPGEIHVRTPCLARGYLDDPAQTQARFLTNPFTDLADDRVYRTGDIGRYLPDGAVEWLGRADRQLKVRGFRLEPAEVEARLLEHPDARAALVIATADAHGDARLVGYVVVRAGAALEARAWRRFLLARLPEPAVPSALVRLERLPLTPNGKPDPRALPAPEQAVTEGATPSGPRDLLEAHLLRAWETVLGRQGVGVRDNFFELGGHSLMAARLFAQLERSVGLRLPLAVLFEAPTIEAQAAALRRSGWTPPWSSLVAIQPAGRRPPFFCVHGVGGNVLGFQSLARHLGADQPVYGLQSAGLDGRRAPHTRFEDMAAHYLRELRRLQPEGPYFLGGLSFGGLIAYEMACQLRESGEEVALVALFDTASRGFLASLSPAQAARARLESIGARLRFNLRQQLAGPDRAGFLRRKFRALLRRWRRRLWQALHSWFPHRGATLPAPLRGVREANYLASRRYVPRPYAGRLALFRAAEKQVGRLKEHDLGWSRLARGGVDVREVAGSHTSMILEPHVAVLAARLRETMDRAMATPGAAKQSCPQPAAA
jgi:amino acid adenylation domain-containing protein